MDIMEAIYRRRAVRAFANEPVSRQVLQDLVDAAIHAPSARNQQPWVFSVVTGAAVPRIAAPAKAYMLSQLPAEGPMAAYREHLGNPAFDIFYGAPALVVIAATATDLWQTEDCALAAQNLMLAAHARGLGTCWVGFARAWLNLPEGKAALGLPAHCTPVAPLIVGRPLAPPPVTERRAAEIHWVE